MASLVEHVAQAKHNLLCATKSLQDGECRDWTITAAFYSAVHFAEAGFTSIDVGHSESNRPQNEEHHAYRGRLVREKYGDTCYRSYRKLQEASYNVRYLALWSSRPGVGLDYYSQADARKFVEQELPLIRREIQARTINLD